MSGIQIFFRTDAVLERALVKAAYVNHSDSPDVSLCIQHKLVEDGYGKADDVFMVVCSVYVFRHVLHRNLILAV